ncbi:hypothetical protein [Actinotalea fermentans]|uniref:Uncharacterized protein n=1 Tax=Actinotalea fermentans TaxID=43671 RepID=A0A511Z1D6_9CELL|nr:hypothetical protein [Actinotalea fermentans]GEN81252.1 hypothetical protein AFE02nite_29860 [Actinotalea fermentans]
MKEHRGDPVPQESAPAHASAHEPDDELARRITRALRSREALTPAPAFVARRVEAELALRAGRPTSAGARRQDALRQGARRHGGRIVAAGAATGALAVGVAGAAAAAVADPYSDVARAVESAAQALGIDWSPMPAGYSRDEYDAFWASDYTNDDVAALSELWNTDLIQTKATIGQMLLDGEPVPMVPGSAPQGTDEGVWSTLPDGYTREQYEAFWGAGYTQQDVSALAALWNLDDTETKARAGQMLLDGEPVPVAPGSTPADS